MQINSVVIAGNLTQDPEVRETPNGNTVCNMRIAANRGGREEGDTTFIDVTAWMQTAVACGQYLQKGSKVDVLGRIAQDKWLAKDGNKRSKHFIVAHNVQFADKPQIDEDETVEVATSAEEAPF